MKEKLASAKNFVADRKVVILTVAAVALTGVVALQQAGIQQHNKFLKEHDLYDTYYTQEDE